MCTVGEGVRGKDLLLAAVFDGHGGWQASEFARRTLLAGVAADLAPAASGDAGASTTSDPMLIAAALTRAFERTDSTFVNKLVAAGRVDARELGGLHPSPPHRHSQLTLPPPPSVVCAQRFPVGLVISRMSAAVPLRLLSRLHM